MLTKFRNTADFQVQQVKEDDHRSLEPSRCLYDLRCRSSDRHRSQLTGHPRSANIASAKLDPARLLSRSIASLILSARWFRPWLTIDAPQTYGDHMFGDAVSEKCCQNRAKDFRV
ncbi:hypothetical protein ALQ25_200005 [Pseudomonas coronafaciens pv. atropurpurea]|nr:hypothetical protein ALQ25_200005 [Pseudomonas coronafaciens pv. atropurpurea]